MTDFKTAVYQLQVDIDYNFCNIGPSSKGIKKYKKVTTQNTLAYTGITTQTENWQAGEVGTEVGNNHVGNIARCFT